MNSQVKKGDSIFSFWFTPTLSLDSQGYRIDETNRNLLKNPSLASQFDSEEKNRRIFQDYVNCNSFGFRQILKDMSNLDKSELPDILVLNEAAWPFVIIAQEFDHLGILDHYFIDGKRLIFDSLRKLSQKVEILTMSPPKFNDFLINKAIGITQFGLMHRHFIIGKLDSGSLNYIEMSHRELMPGKVIFWNTLSPIWEWNYQNCYQIIKKLTSNFTQKTNQTYDSNFRCWDYSHPGEQAYYKASQVFYNYFCE